MSVDVTTIEGVPISQQYISDCSSAVGLTVPTKADSVLLHVRTNPVHMEIDGGDATDSDGILPAGFIALYENAATFMANVSFIDTSAGTANISAWYFNCGRK